MRSGLKNTSNSLLTRVLPGRKEHTYDGVLTTFVAIGNGKTVVVSQIEDRPLCIDVYGLKVSTVEESQVNCEISKCDRHHTKSKSSKRTRQRNF
jgi:hypothetical protein